MLTLRDMNVGCMVSLAQPEEGAGEGESDEEEGEEGGLGPAYNVHISFALFSLAEGIREPYYDGKSVWDSIWVYLQIMVLPWPFGPHVAG